MTGKALRRLWAARDDRYALRRMHGLPAPLTAIERDAVVSYRASELRAATDPGVAEAGNELRAWSPPGVR